jgi:hypothetical protein
MTTDEFKTEKMRMTDYLTRRLFCLVAGVVALLTLRAAAQTTVHIPAAQDATLYGGTDATNNNSGSGPGMFVGSDPSNPKRGLIEFNIPAYVPAGATINSVTLTLYMDMVAGSGGGTGGGDTTPRTIRLFEVTTPWHGGTNGTTRHAGPGFGGAGHGFAPPNPGDPTWNFASYNTVPWTTPGGDFSSTESADTVVSQNLNSPYTWGSTSQMVADVQGWLNGTLANHGWLLKNDSEATSQTFRAFYTAEGAVEQSVPQFAPNLAVTFVPEPVGISVFGLVPLLLRRRRQVR